jgi:hypothetical protein
VEIDGTDRPIEWLLDRLAACDNVLPLKWCDALELPPGSPYADAVEIVAEKLRTSPKSVELSADE